MSTPHGFDHVFVHGRVESRARTSRGGGNLKITPVDRAKHGRTILDQVQEAFGTADDRRAREVLQEDLRATGTYLTLEGPGVEFSLQLDQLTSMTRPRKNTKRPRWLLLAVHPASEGAPEYAAIWVADDFRAEFLQVFEDYLDPKKDRVRKDGTPGNPSNNALVANIDRVRSTFLEELWTSDGEPPLRTSSWWELWLDTRREKWDLVDRCSQRLGSGRA